MFAVHSDAVSLAPREVLSVGSPLCHCGHRTRGFLGFADHSAGLEEHLCSGHCCRAPRPLLDHRLVLEHAAMLLPLQEQAGVSRC